MKFKVGESIVCINDNFRWAKRRYAMFNITYPVIRKCYVVRKYMIGGSHPALGLIGIHNPRVPYSDGRVREAGFWEERFERAPSIESIKHAMEAVSRWLPAADDPIFAEDEELEDA